MITGSCSRYACTSIRCVYGVLFCSWEICIRGLHALINEKKIKN